MNKIEVILEVLDEYYPEAICELNYQKDYELLIAVMLSSQTTDKKVNGVTAILFKEYPSLEDLERAPIESLKDIIKPIGFYNVKALNVKKIALDLLKNHEGIVPNDREILEALPGVGHKTANVVLSNLFNVPCIAVDTHVSRVSKRLKLAKEKDDVKDIENKLMKLIPKSRWSKAHHQLVLFGRYICLARNPLCLKCQLKGICAYQEKKN